MLHIRREASLPGKPRVLIPLATKITFRLASMTDKCGSATLDIPKYMGLYWPDGISEWCSLEDICQVVFTCSSAPDDREVLAFGYT